MKSQRLAQGLMVTCFVLGACGARSRVGESVSRTSDPDEARTPPIDLGMMDTNVDPCADFYQYACGTWVQNTPIPPGKSGVSRAASQADDVWKQVVDLLEQAKAGQLDDPDAHRIGDYYASCLSPNPDAALEFWKRELAAIDQMTDAASFARVSARMNTAHIRGLFYLTPVVPNFWANGAEVISGIDATVFSMKPSQYQKATPADVAAVDAMQAYAARVFAFIGEGEDAAKADAETVVDIETSLAQHTTDLEVTDTEMTDSAYHPAGLEALKVIAPNVAWDEYLKTAGVSSDQTFELFQRPEFFRAISDEIGRRSLSAQRAFLRFRFMNTMGLWESRLLPAGFPRPPVNPPGDAPLPKADVPEELQCARMLVGVRGLGDAVARPYIKRAFDERARVAAKELVERLRTALRDRVAATDWIDVGTRAEAVAKIDAIDAKIVHPDTFHSLEGLRLDRSSLLSNLVAANRFDYAADAASVRRPSREVGDSARWAGAGLVFTYYSPYNNFLIVGAPSLMRQFSHDADFFQLAAQGSRWAAEISRALYGEGQRFDSTGTLRSWVSDATAQAGKSRAQCLVDQFSAYEPMPGVHVDGEGALAGSVAGAIGLEIALRVLADEALPPPEPTGGLAPMQQFFVAYAQARCAKLTPDALAASLKGGGMPAADRVNGTLADTPEFAAAFQCKTGTALAPASVCRAW
jgi:predicted metalloendopeptidase